MLGVPVVYVQGLFPKTMGTLLCMFINTPTVIFVTVFVWGNIFDQHLEINILPRNLFGGIVRFIFGLLLCGIILTANARVLHVGDNTIKLSESKITTPALHIRVGDKVWYGNMTTHSTSQKLHIKHNDKIYSVCSGEKKQVGDYEFIGDCLVGANNNLYLESTGTQWIDTGFIPNQGTKLIADYQFLSMNSYRGYTEVQIGCGSANNSKRFVISITKQKWHFAIGAANKTYVLADLDRHLFTLDAPNKTSWIDNTPYKTPYDEFQSDYSFGIFTRNDSTSLWPFRHAARSFYTQIYQDDVLVRHFVPVPCGLQIGDFVVPSNGMWDIVEQKFYGNMGTGDFIYGMDE